MINIFYEPFPEEVQADGVSYPIITDFREWFRFADMISERELDTEEKLLLMAQWLTAPPQRMTAELVRAVFAFYRAKELDRDAADGGEDEGEAAAAPPVIDWRIDAKYILGDFRRSYGIDLLNVPYMHWWEFRCLFAALPDDSQCMKRMAYRSADLSQIKNEHERRRVARMKQLFALPFELDDEDIGEIFLN